ncbi:hypothetical protein FSP39_022633 [Pinctada imbricata]|uniref:ATP-dependent DNA helicase n=1 Tax=Pinctada imbricata TaxID=66713 RepID=A0AA89BY58_PINIB|nr:hypothetical protein FSP39_022633 [Pinctada imbricata]
MSSFGRRSTDPNMSCTSGYRASSIGSPDNSHISDTHQNSSSRVVPPQPVFNMNRMMSTSGTSNRTKDTTYNQSACNPQEPSNFSFDYNINNNSGVVATQKSFNQQKSKHLELCDDVDFIEQCQDDLFSDEFQDETDFNEPGPTADQDNLPSMSRTPRRQSTNSSAIKTPNSASKQEVENKEYDGYNFPHSKEMVKIFHKVFGLREFRTNQLKAINAALLENDCFILMPTGGGKSLCYQLPALVTGGVSVIVSPLRALIQDQVTRLNSMNVPAAQLSSDIDQNQAEFVYRKMYYKTPEITLLYVTPEKQISASTKLLNCLDNLYKRKLLARFVIDEAHCVSQWGHDFRPDYKKLHVLKEKYPGVPMMALTATANMRVRKDIIHQLGMKDPKRFVQSFNRPNLKFRVENKKPSTLTADITKLIKEQFSAKCGIVYCLSRNECDTVARDLSKSGIQAVSYHAGLNDGERVAIQEKWLNGNRCKVICATIAFGMGIDKPDVRFVIHYSLPKSMEGYYQEAGRAGRDGMLAHCILYYTYQDVKRLRRIIEMDQNAHFESRRVHIDNLFRMVQYCENVADCRRAQLLNYFGERDFDRETCDKFRGSICDNCVSKESFQLRDVTDDVKEIVKCVKDITMNGRRNNNYTLLHFVDIFRGAKTGKICDLGHDKVRLYGSGKSYSRQDGERLFRKLVIDRILMEDLQITAAEHTACYIKLGPKSNDVMMGKLKVELQVQGSRKRTEVAKIGKEPVSKKEALIEECYAELVEMAKVIAAERSVRNFATVFPTATLRELAKMMPESEEEMIQQEIEGLTEFRVKTYNACRFIPITSKYREKLEDLGDTSQTEEEGDLPEWESHYFNEESSGTGNNNRKRGSWRRGIRRKRQGGTRNTKKEGNAKKPNLGQYSFKGRGSTKSSRGGHTVSQSSTSSRAKTGNTLGFMPVPQPRSFLSNPSGGAYF